MQKYLIRQERKKYHKILRKSIDEYCRFMVNYKSPKGDTKQLGGHKEMNTNEFNRLANELIEKTVQEEIAGLDIGVMVEVTGLVKRGVKKLFGVVYDYTKDHKTLWVETAEDIYKVDSSAVKVVEKTQPTKGFNLHKTKLTEQAVRDIYLMATTSNMSHKQIVGWVLIHHGSEIVPKTVSEIKLGKRWKKLNLLSEGWCGNEN